MNHILQPARGEGKPAPFCEHTLIESKAKSGPAISLPQTMSILC
jgi:hypothetical protein